MDIKSLTLIALLPAVFIRADAGVGAVVTGNIINRTPHDVTLNQAAGSMKRVSFPETVHGTASYQFQVPQSNHDLLLTVSYRIEQSGGSVTHCIFHFVPQGNTYQPIPLTSSSTCNTRGADIIFK